MSPDYTYDLAVNTGVGDWTKFTEKEKTRNAPNPRTRDKFAKVITYSDT
jgi:hypothetical protein